MSKSISFPDMLYLVTDQEGQMMWYTEDPMKNPEAKNISLEHSIRDLVGTDCTVENPIMVKLNAAYYNRAEPFDISLPGKIRKGALNRHFEDGEGACVDILAVETRDVNYPFNAVVFDRNGEIISTRKYSTSGNCSDGNPKHRLWSLYGPMPNTQRQDVRENPQKENETPKPENAANPQTQPEQKPESTTEGERDL